MHMLCVCVFVGWWVACLCIIPLVEFGFKHKSENSHRHSLQYAWPTSAAYSVLKTTHEVTLTVSLWKISAFKSMFVCVCVTVVCLNRHAHTEDQQFSDDGSFAEMLLSY